METNHSVHELSFNEMDSTNGGGFAYDAGFFLREIWVYATSNEFGVAVDLGQNYRPVN